MISVMIIASTDSIPSTDVLIVFCWIIKEDMFTDKYIAHCFMPTPVDPVPMRAVISLWQDHVHAAVFSTCQIWFML